MDYYATLARSKFGGLEEDGEASSGDEHMEGGIISPRNRGRGFSAQSSREDGEGQRAGAD